ncbi:brain-specific angiogenesis inhibitor 1-associated protein 2 [Engraulis encrasicolus]|uniref:brain-specific angiogenesis inhibitor 1-associated protein 2 n=1 Tax=Engraulis encrasicolus TaxID=184585 RepID=UPI002FD10FB9
MVPPEADPKMSRTEEVHRITENVYKSIMEQFNPCLRNFVAMAKTYEKALSSVTFAAKGYFDALVRMGELASESHGSKDLGDVLFQMAEVHRQIQIQLEEMLRSFHNELLTELEKKVELDARYLNAALKKYQMEHKSKGESLERCQAELKKLRRKSQGSKHGAKYGDKEMQCVETISSKQSELDGFVAEAYRAALSEERLRYCFLVDRQCAVAKSANQYHSKGKELLGHKLPLWHQACAEPTKLPERAMLLAQQMGSAAGTMSSAGAAGTLHSHKGGAMHISDPMPGAKPLPMPAELAALINQQRAMGLDGGVMLNGGAHGGDDYQHWMEGKGAVGQGKASAQGHRMGGDSYSNTLPARKVAPAKSSSSSSAETQTLPRSSSMAAGLDRHGRTRVQAIYSHAAGDNSTLLSFSEGDIITLLVPEARDGWHYGENEKNRMRGWFPFSYTRVISEPEPEPPRHTHISLQHGRSSSTGNLLDRESVTMPMSDYGIAMTTRLMQHQHHASQQSLAHAHARQRPYSVAVPTYTQHQGMEDYERFPTSSEVKLISTV